jgi:hypothetical protein
MSSEWIDLSALWKIVVVGLLAGAGLPALYAVGIRALATGEQPGDERIWAGSKPGLGVAALCLAIVLAAIGYGIYLIVSSS